MTLHEFFVQRWESEQPAFLSVLSAMPGDALEYTPHSRSTKAGDLAWQLVQEQLSLAGMLDTGEIAWAAVPRPATIDEIVSEWKRATAVLREKLTAIDEAKYAAPALMKAGEETIWSDSSGNMLWGFLFDMVHHRGQLSTYLRPMGGKVPSIYGPSADSK